MNKLVATFLKVIFTILLLGLIGVVALSYFIRPDAIKPKLIDYVSTQYGRTLSMGDIHWTLFPTLGISLEDVSLGNTTEFGSAPFASIKKLHLAIDATQLLKGAVHVNKLALTGLQANLKTNAQGANNWDNLLVNSTASAKQTTASTATGRATEKAEQEIVMSMDLLQIQDANLVYENANEGKVYQISNLLFEAEDLGFDKAFPIELKMTLSSSTPKFFTDFSAKATVTLAQALLPDLNAVSISGQMDMPVVEVNGMKITALKAPITFKNNVLNLNPVSALFYGGRFKGDAQIDMTSSPSQVAVNYQLADAQMGPLFKDIAGKEQFTGALSLNGRLDFKNFPTDKQLMQSLNGSARLSLKNGVLNGVDLPYFYTIGTNLINPKNPLPARKNTGSTPFLVTNADFTIKQGILSNQNLVLFNDGIYGAGAGTVDLVANQIQYRFKIQGVKKSATGEFEPAGQVIPLQITGSTKNPNISLDMAAVTQNVVNQVIEKQLDKAVGQKGIGSKLLQSLQGQGQ